MPVFCFYIRARLDIQGSFHQSPSRCQIFQQHKGVVLYTKVVRADVEELFIRESSWLAKKKYLKAIAPPRLRAKRGEDLGGILQ